MFLSSHALLGDSVFNSELVQAKCQKLKEYIINEKILKVYNDEKNKGILKSLLQLLMVI